MKKAIWTFVFTTIALAIILVFASIFRPTTQPVVNDVVDVEFSDTSIDGFGELPTFETPDDSFFLNPGVENTDSSQLTERVAEESNETVVEEGNGDTTDNGVFIAEGCQLTGCSGTVCANAGEDIVTTCEWQEKYACYQQSGTQCIQDTQGQCGWAMNQELQMCLETEAGGEV